MIKINQTKLELFGKLSGDFNPLHLDSTYAKQSFFGGQIIYGIYQVFLCLEDVLQRDTKVKISSLKAQFIKPIFKDTPFTMRTKTTMGGGNKTYYYTLLYKGEIMSKIEFSTQIQANKPSTKIREHYEIESLNYDNALLQELFPICASLLDSQITATLLASTRIVGMKYPGEHSIYSSLECDFSNAINSKNIEFSYKKHDILQTYIITIHSPFICKIKAFIRPQLLANKSLDELNMLYPHLSQSKPFSVQKALIIGASSGIGNSCAKLLALGGAQILASYHNNDIDITQSILKPFSKASFTSFKYNALKPDKKALQAIQDFNPTHIYYFATPKIQAYTDTKKLNKKALINFLNHYIFGLEKILHITNAEVLFSPSSVFVEELPRAFREYTLAKMMFEGYVKYATSLQCYTPRLEKLQTNQTLQITKQDLKTPDMVLIDLLSTLQKAKES